MTAVAKLTSKYQATIPLPVRKALGIKAGDVIAFEIKEGYVKLTRATPRDLAYAQAVEGTLGEWDSPADEDAYRDL